MVGDKIVPHFRETALMNWKMWAAIAAWMYVVLVFVSLYYVDRQLDEVAKNRKREAILAIFRELESDAMRESRQYIYDEVPREIEGIAEVKLKEHFKKAAVALNAFSRIEYLISEGHIDAETILASYSQAIWRCFKKCEWLIRWVRRKRNEPQYLQRFDNLSLRAEAYRREHGYDEPSFY